MKYTTVYVGMDVHKESFTLACYTNEKEEAEYYEGYLNPIHHLF